MTRTLLGGEGSIQRWVPGLGNLRHLGNLNVGSNHDVMLNDGLKDFKGMELHLTHFAWTIHNVAMYYRSCIIICNGTY